MQIEYNPDGYAQRHRTDAQGIALAYGIPLKTAQNVLSTDLDDWNTYPIVKTAMVLGPLRCFRDWEGGWRLDGELTTPRRIYLAARAVRDAKRPFRRVSHR